MRVLSRLLSACLVFFAAVSGEAQASSSLGAGSATVGPATDAPSPLKTYSNDTLHLRYSYPASFTDAGVLVSAAFKASVEETPSVGKDAAHCITLPFSVMNTAGGQLSIVLLVRADAACLKRTFTPAQLHEFTQGEVQGLSASGAKPQFSEPVNFTVSGHAAEQMYGSFALPTGDSMRAMVTCVLVKPDVACWQFLGKDEESLRRMSAFPVTFDNGAPATLTPPPPATRKP